MARRIMFVDDDPFLATLTRVTLERMGHVAETFLDPVTALEAFRDSSAQYDLVLCDVHIDRACGFELAREMKRLRPDAAVVMLSGNVEEPDLIAGRDIGVLAVLPKSEVMTRLDEALALYVR